MARFIHIYPQENKLIHSKYTRKIILKEKLGHPATHNYSAPLRLKQPERDSISLTHICPTPHFQLSVV